MAFAVRLLSACAVGGLLLIPVVAFAFELPQLVVGEDRGRGESHAAYIEWEQVDSADYGYVITRQVQDGTEVTVLELLPAPLGNNQRSSGGVFVDEGVEAGQSYTYNIYPYQRNELQIGDTGQEFSASGGSSNTAFAKDAKQASLTVPIQIKGQPKTVAQGDPETSPSQQPQQVDDKCTGLIDPDCSLKENLEHLYPIAVRIIIFLALLGVIYAGYLYITSFGQKDRISEAKNWLLAAIVGIALILLIPVIIDALDTLPLPGK